MKLKIIYQVGVKKQKHIKNAQIKKNQSKKGDIVEDDDINILFTFNSMDKRADQLTEVSLVECTLLG